MAKYAPIAPSSGYILTKPHVEDKVFKSVKETDGQDQLSEVIAIGASIRDTNGDWHASPAPVGAIIYHAYSNKEFERDFTKYRFVHFTEIHGILEVKDAA